MTPAQRGFTLVEVAVTVAIAGILAAASVAYWNSAIKNASAGDAVFDVGLRLDGLRAVAMREGVAYGAIVMDAAENDAGKCSPFSRERCARTCVVRDPPAAWDVTTIDPIGPGLSDCTAYSGVRFDLASAVVPPAPFATVVPNDPALVRVQGDRRLVAIRFDPDGTARLALAGASPSAVSIRLGSTGAAALVKGVLVTFPYGLVRTY
jgi:prepilin-type N-terminal cleavage/methylation domain-containing protein